MATTQRRLSAILHADIAGFVRLTESEELGTFQRLKSIQADVWRPAIEQAGGRLIHSAGDAVLAEFGSAVAAVTAAIDIQERMARFNAALDQSQHMLFRIGVHLGEIIVDEGEQDIFGDGVNLAARIQSIAEPGGIAVSRAVRDVAELRIEYAFVDGGEHRLKNVSRPVQIYHLRARAGASLRTTTSALPKATLRFHGSDLAGHTFSFELALDRLMSLREGLVIGRDAGQCDLPLVHATVSRRHARLTFTGNGLHVEDLGSTNGTSVDGTVLRPGAALTLNAGAKLRIGEVELAFRQG
jgi:adenylate cyclase